MVVGMTFCVVIAAVMLLVGSVAVVGVVEACCSVAGVMLVGREGSGTVAAI
jgi:hypothetical protein